MFKPSDIKNSFITRSYQQGVIATGLGKSSTSFPFTFQELSHES